MNEKLAELIAKNSKQFGFLKDEKTLEAITAIKETFIDKFLERGDIRLLVLDSLSKSPKHGYQIMISISKRFHEVYKPSPGVIYPTLQSLSEEELVNFEESDKKKIYSLTKNGEKHLKQNRKRMDGIISEFESAYSGGHDKLTKNMDGIISLWIELAYNVFFKPRAVGAANGKDLDKKMAEVEKILKNTSEELNKVWS